MQRATVNGVELEYAYRPSEQPMLLIHGAHIADALTPLLRQDDLAACGVVHYHRRGYAGSSHPGPATTREQALDALALLDHLGIDRAHLVGHSYGAVIALELAATAPDRVSSLVQLEPALLSGASGQAFGAVLAPLVECYQAGDPVAAVDQFLAGIGRDDWREAIERAVPGGVEQAERDAATFYEVELLAASRWTFDRHRATPITCPVLSVLGTATAPLFVEGRQLLHDWFPQCQDIDIAGASHLLPIEAPAAVASAIAAFLTREAAQPTLGTNV
jgi:pimeloyl-ACP methyl ester carboxylesterase